MGSKWPKSLHGSLGPQSETAQGAHAQCTAQHAHCRSHRALAGHGGAAATRSPVMEPRQGLALHDLRGMVSPPGRVRVLGTHQSTGSMWMRKGVVMRFGWWRTSVMRSSGHRLPVSDVPRVTQKDGQHEAWVD
jgi:hypothetical protein